MIAVGFLAAGVAAGVAYEYVFGEQVKPKKGHKPIGKVVGEALKEFVYTMHDEIEKRESMAAETEVPKKEAAATVTEEQSSVGPEIETTLDRK